MLDIMWIWGIVGLVLLGVEIVSGTMHAFWFGIAALLVAVLTWLIPAMPLTLQLLLFSVFSIGALIVWQRYCKKTSTDLRIGQSQGDEIGRVGTIIAPVGPKQTGRILFTQGVMGSREWTAIADEEIAVDAEAVIVAIEGNSLRVKSH
ncbi:MAG: NfeD family protein [Methylobacillus sp.]|jgi:membrane protein implicated in regulation of membrane protease activity|nr:NfeD family protein [Methylobacillus sp.]